MSARKAIRRLVKRKIVVGVMRFWTYSATCFLRVELHARCLPRPAAYQVYTPSSMLLSSACMVTENACLVEGYLEIYA
jgi:hypothetical protein